MSETAKAPWHLWVVGIVSLLWNFGGANDYVRTKLVDREYLQGGADMVGVPVETVIAYFAAYPLWANIAWALGVWGAVAGSILLLLRRRYAFHAFAISLAGLIVSTVYTVISDRPAEFDTPFFWAFSAAIWVITLLLMYYSRRMTSNGVLR